MLLVVSVLIGLFVGPKNNLPNDNLPSLARGVVVSKEAVKYHGRGLGATIYFIKIEATDCSHNCPTNVLVVAQTVFLRTKIGSIYQCKKQSC